MQFPQKFILPLFSFFILATAGCSPHGFLSADRSITPQDIKAEESLPTPTDLQNVDPENRLATLFSTQGVRPGTTTDVMIFNGQGVSTADWQGIEKLVHSLNLSYLLVNTAQLNFMSFDQLTQFGLIIVPGGSRGVMMKGLTDLARLNIKKAVRDFGVSYLGFSAGAYAAVGALANSNLTSEDDLSVISGPHLSVWRHHSGSPNAALTHVKFSDHTEQALVWWSGPATPEWNGGVVARYQDGQPAISQGWNRKGFVMLSGLHPEAPSSWKKMAGLKSGESNSDLAQRLILASLYQTPLPTF